MTTLKTLFEQAQHAQQLADNASDAVRNELLIALKKLIPEGSVVDLRQRRDRSFPEYLRSLHTTGGKDHGSSIFRIDQITNILFNPRVPEHCSWEALATVISEKTGLPLNGSVSHSTNKRGTKVSVASSFCIVRHPEETPEDQLQRLLAVLDPKPTEEAEAALPRTEEFLQVRSMLGNAPSTAPKTKP